MTAGARSRRWQLRGAWSMSRRLLNRAAKEGEETMAGIMLGITKAALIVFFAVPIVVLSVYFVCAAERMQKQEEGANE